MQTQLNLYKRMEMSEGEAVCFPFASARGCTQILKPERQDIVQRTIQGLLTSTEAPWEQKFRSVIQCQDFFCPSLDELYPGIKLSVECLVNFWTAKIKTNPSSFEEADMLVEDRSKDVLLSRKPVRGSLVFSSPEGDRHVLIEDRYLYIKEVKSRKNEYYLRLPSELHEIFPQGGYVGYRPELNMTLEYFHISTQEWSGKTQWEISLLED